MVRLLALACVMVLPGCASVIGSKLQPLSVQTVLDNKEVVSVGCTLTNDVGKWFVTAPGSVTIQKSTADLAVECSKANQMTGREMVVSKANGGAWGNILAGGVIGYVVDRNTGAGFDYPNTVTVTMTRLADVPVGDPSEAVRPSAQNPPPVTLAAAPKAALTGQDSFQVQNMVRGSKCSADPLAALTAKGPGFETYTVSCDNGDAMSFRCEFGNCRQLK